MSSRQLLALLMILLVCFTNTTSNDSSRGHRLQLPPPLQLLFGQLSLFLFAPPPETRAVHNHIVRRSPPHPPKRRQLLQQRLRHLLVRLKSRTLLRQHLLGLQRLRHAQAVAPPRYRGSGTTCTALGTQIWITLCTLLGSSDGYNNCQSFRCFSCGCP